MDTEKKAETVVEVKILSANAGYRERIMHADSKEEAKFLLQSAYTAGISDHALRRCRKVFEEKWGDK